MTKDIFIIKSIKHSFAFKKIHYIIPHKVFFESMSDIFYEIKEAIENERLSYIWKKSRYFVLGFCCAALLITAAITYFNASAKKKNQHSQEKYEEIVILVNNKNYVDALDAIDMLIKNGTTGYVHLATLLKACISVKLGKTDVAQSSYDFLISKSQDLKEFFQYFALLSGDSSHADNKKNYNDHTAMVDLLYELEIWKSIKNANREYKINALKDLISKHKKINPIRVALLISASKISIKSLEK